MLQSVWHVRLSEHILYLYRLLVLYRQPLIRTKSGYHVPSSEEVIAGIRAYFNPAHLSDVPPSTAGEDTSDSQRIRAEVLRLFLGTCSNCISSDIADALDVQWYLLGSIRYYLVEDPSLVAPSYVDLLDQDSPLDVPVHVSEAISKASTANDVRLVLWSCGDSSRLGRFLMAWIWLHRCLNYPNAGPACECPFVYFFVKHCLVLGLGVPKLALTAYDRMNMQLSREFIRCANPTCELSKLDKSTGKIKFKNCSRCRAVIYCSRECQTAHYPEHKSRCSEHPTG